MREPENNNYKPIFQKFFKPITETQKATAREITEELKPIKEGIENLPQAIAFSANPSIQAFEEPPEGEDTQFIGEVAEKYLRKFATKVEADTTFRLYDRHGNFYIRDKLAIIVDNDLVVGKDEYEGTPGLWELFVSKKPTDYTDEDKKNYAKLMLKLTLFTVITIQKINVQKAVKVINGILYLKTFGLIGKGMKEAELLSFRVILTCC